MARSAWRAALAIPSCLAASIRALEASAKAMDISPPHCDDWKPHQAVSTAVTESTMRTTVSRTSPGGRLAGASAVLFSDVSAVLISLPSTGPVAACRPGSCHPGNRLGQERVAGACARPRNDDPRLG